MRFGIHHQQYSSYYGN